jgi:hypothetical protein
MLPHILIRSVKELNAKAISHQWSGFGIELFRLYLLIILDDAS